MEHSFENGKAEAFETPQSFFPADRRRDDRRTAYVWLHGRATWIRHARRSCSRRRSLRRTGWGSEAGRARQKSLASSATSSNNRPASRIDIDLAVESSRTRTIGNNPPTSSLGSWTSAMTRGRPAASPRPLRVRKRQPDRGFCDRSAEQRFVQLRSLAIVSPFKTGGRLTPPPGIKGSKDKGSNHQVTGRRVRHERR